ncbi:MAG: L-seryl-tRNA(Sec) selenium transferase, partial [Corynebacterium casei]
MTDLRRFIPRADEILASPAVEVARRYMAEHIIRTRINKVLAQARAGDISPQAVMDEVAAVLADATPYSLHRVLNATGVIIHTNIGRAPLPPQAIDALVAAAGYTDVELDLATGLRSKNRGRAAIEALLAACPGAEDALVVNNGAAALLLATAALAPEREVII